MRNRYVHRYMLETHEHDMRYAHNKNILEKQQLDQKIIHANLYHNQFRKQTHNITPLHVVTMI